MCYIIDYLYDLLFLEYFYFYLNKTIFIQIKVSPYITKDSSIINNKNYYLYDMLLYKNLTDQKRLFDEGYDDARDNEKIFLDREWIKK